MLRRFSINFAIFSMVVDMAMVAGALRLAVFIRPMMNSWSFIAYLPETARMPAILYVVFPVTFLVVLAAISIYDGRKYLRLPK
jgi:uncharacterized Tic20 family protein